MIDHSSSVRADGTAEAVGRERGGSSWPNERNLGEVQKQIEGILRAHTSAPFGGLFGEKIVNVLEVNLELRKHFGAPAS